LKLFNSRGIRSVSLRDIAARMGISYGNLTYHYSNKEILITWIYIQMIEEQEQLGKNLENEENLLQNVLSIPGDSFDISCKYLFLFQDFVEIARNYPSIAEMQSQVIYSDQDDMANVYTTLMEQGLFRSDISKPEIDFLIEIRNYMRSFYFMKLANKPRKGAAKKPDREEYVQYMNGLLYPYLTPKGMKDYKGFLK